jgi:hypothetical protein
VFRSRRRSRLSHVWDDSVMESFLASLKIERVYRQHFQARNEAKRICTTTWSGSRIPIGATLGLGTSVQQCPRELQGYVKSVSGESVGIPPGSENLCLRQSSFTATPRSASFRNPMICSSVYRFFTSNLHPESQTLDHIATQERVDVDWPLLTKQHNFQKFAPVIILTTAIGRDKLFGSWSEG